MKVVVLKPKINSKFHFGTGSLESTSYFLHSNTIFSTIINNYVKLYVSNDLDIEKIKNIRLSSLYPKIEDIFLIPKPEHPYFYILDNKHIMEGIKPKDVKKISYFSIGFYKELLNNEKDENYWHNNLKEILENKYGNIILTDKEIDKIRNMINKESLFGKEIEHKIAMDRIKNITLELEKGQLYSVEFFKPNNNVEFYFLIDYNGLDKDTTKKIDASIKLIEDEGLGGERTSGAGFFETVEIEDIPNNLKEIFDKNEDCEYKMLLGVGIPKEEDIKNIEYYKLLELGGYIYSSTYFKYLTKRKKTILALSEGSIVKNNFVGNVVDTTPNIKEKSHSVYTHGKPILLPTKRWNDDFKS
ncbi:type III-A CRISPR-associated RAMP protein Csm4 [Methanocaldococcus indicus]|uniref:type III-A CRISPR-associated RAMP protein Csm4 n=1 Tax=Methanocaldococcus indicus TaxID=213231 RepID=UPI003C6D9F86